MIKTLFKISVCSMISLFLSAMLIELWVVYLSVKDSSGYSLLDSLVLVGSYTLIIGIFFVFLYAVPVYLILESYKKATWITTIGFGILPGIVMLVSVKDYGLAYYSIFCGGVTAAMKHFLYKWNISKRH